MTPRSKREKERSEAQLTADWRSSDEVCVCGGNETPLGEVPSWAEALSRDITTPGECLKVSEF